MKDHLFHSSGMKYMTLRSCMPTFRDSDVLHINRGEAALLALDKSPWPLLRSTVAASTRPGLRVLASAEEAFALPELFLCM